ncbi:MAG TPA: ABC transporter substrate-binding protein [Stellaceae bacterium]|nr:ABC transporter substrate-binding protein [Stellaceae bacterium]
MRRVAVSMSTTEGEPHEESAVAAFTEALQKLGWVPGSNLELVQLWGRGDARRMQANAGELVALAPDAILAKGGTMPALQAATSTIPIVFVVTGDAAALSYTGNFAHPRGNITGFSTPESDLVGKRLELLRQIAPAVSRVLYVWSRDVGGVSSPDLLSRITAAAKQTGVDLVDGVAETPAAIKQAIGAFASAGGNGLVVAFNAFTNVHRGLIVKLAARHRLPGAYPLVSFAEDGGLFSYAFDQDEMFRQAAGYIDRILRGAAPADLPVQFPTRFKLVINLATAKALGLSLSPVLLAQADEVIE